MARGRKPQVRYWASRKGGGFFCTIRGDQIELALGADDSRENGPTYKAAVKKYASLVAMTDSVGTSDYRLSALFNKYRIFLVDKHPKRLANFGMAKSFADLHGDKRVSDLRGYHLNDWLASKAKDWCATSQWNAAQKVMAALNWGAKSQLIPSNPLRGHVEIPRFELRGKEARMSAELCDLLISSCHSPKFALFLRVLRETGCRPIELQEATCGHFNKGRLVYPWNPRKGEYRHKTWKTKRDRTVYLTGELAEVVGKIVSEKRTGLIFTTPRGKKFTSNNTFKMWDWLLERPAVVKHLADNHIKREHVTPYSFRHTFITEWVESGRSVKVCADLCGTSVAMIERVYGHPDSDKIHEHYLSFMSAK